METLITQKSFDDLKCSDNFMFAKIMEDPELCKAVLETLLDIKIDRLSYPEAEKTMQAGPDAKAIRLDVHTSDTNRDFDIEIQTTLYKELRQRCRYYQSLMDVDYLQKGHFYSELKQNYVIFICLDDLFGKGLPVYTFENICNEDKGLHLEDKTYKLFYNCSKWKEIKKQDKSSLLKFFLTDEADSDLCTKLKDKERKIKMTERARKEYMDYCMIVNSAKEEGRTEKALEAARKLIINGKLDLIDIADIQDLPLETVQQLAAEIKAETAIRWRE